MTLNDKKVPGAIVWYQDKLMVITNQNVGEDFVLLEDLIKVQKNTIELAKIGDSVKIKDLSILPYRCSKYVDIKIIYFLLNTIVGIVATDSAGLMYEDSISYGHLIR